MAKRNGTRRSAGGRTRVAAKGSPPAPAKPSLRERIQQQLGDTPIDDSLAAVTWMQRALAVVASDVVDSELDDDKKRSEMLKIADRMAKLRDIDRLHQADQTLRGARAQQEEARPGPQMTDDATGLDTAAGSVPTRRGRPPLQRPDGRWAILFDAAPAAAAMPPAKKVKPEGTTYTIVGYRQTAEPAVRGGKANRQAIRFRNAGLRAMARTFRGQPFLTGHNWSDARARGGTVLDAWVEDVDGELLMLFEVLADRGLGDPRVRERHDRPVLDRRRLRGRDPVHAARRADLVRAAAVDPTAAPPARAALQSDAKPAPGPTAAALEDGPDAFELTRDNPNLGRFMKAAKLSVDQVRQHGARTFHVVPNLRDLAEATIQRG